MKEGDNMALQVTNLDVMKKSEIDITEAKNSFDETTNNLRKSIKTMELYWNDRDGYELREKMLGFIDSNIKNISEEMENEIKYIKKVYMILENVQEQVKNRLNSN